MFYLLALITIILLQLQDIKNRSVMISFYLLVFFEPYAIALIRD